MTCLLVPRAGVEPATFHVSGGRPCHWTTGVCEVWDAGDPARTRTEISSLGGSRPVPWTTGSEAHRCDETSDVVPSAFARHRRRESNPVDMVHSHASNRWTSPALVPRGIEPRAVHPTCLRHAIYSRAWGEGTGVRCPGGRIRTSDLLRPRQARSQPAPHPDGGEPRNRTEVCEFSIHGSAD